MTGPHLPISNKYTVTVRNKFDTLQETRESHAPDDEYEYFVTAHIKAAATAAAKINPHLRRYVRKSKRKITQIIRKNRF